MKSIEQRHKNLTHATPHKLLHTGATLAKQPGVIQIPIGEIVSKRCRQEWYQLKKDASKSELRYC